MERKHGEVMGIPELKDDESQIYREVPLGYCNTVKIVEDRFLPRFIMAKRDGMYSDLSVDQLLEMHKDLDGGTFMRFFRHEGITYKIVSIGDVDEPGVDSTVVAINGPDQGKRFLADIGNGAKLKGLIVE